MSPRFLLLIAFAFANLVTVVAQTDRGATLKIGTQVPEIKGVTWVQGDPVDQLKPGQVYVFEFWATWCGPCIQAMPHLSELAKQYAGKVVFVGVSILEDNHGPKGAQASLAKVREFMAKNPGRMNYNVGVDGGGRESYMAATWFRPTGQSGIPATIVVDSKGKIAWIGHPMQLDEVLPRVLSGGLDVTKFDAEQRAKREQAQKAAQARQALLAPLRAALSARDYATFAQLAESLARETPEMADNVAELKAQAFLSARDEKSLRAEFADMEQRGRVGFFAIQLAESITEIDGLEKETYVAAARFLEYAFTRTTGLDRIPRIHAVVARNYFRGGDYTNAVATQERAVQTARNESRMGADEMERLEGTLGLYQAAAGGKN